MATELSEKGVEITDLINHLWVTADKITSDDEFIRAYVERMKYETESAEAYIANQEFVQGRPIT